MNNSADRQKTIVTFVDFSPADQQLIHALSTGMSKAAAGRECDIPRETVSKRWHSDSDFRAAVRTRSVARLDEHDRRIAQLMDKALDELQTLLESDDDVVRIRAITLILSRADAIRGASMDERVERLECRLAGRKLAT